MKKDIQKKILKTAVQSFMKNGYEETTIRSLAKDLDLAVGNINYYYPKKEDIIKDYHNAVLNYFLDEVLKNTDDSNPWITYFAAEYSFMSFIASDEQTNTLYKSFTAVKTLRDFYTEKHQELFLSMFKTLPSSKEEIYLSTLAMCSLEFTLITRFDDHQNEWNFDDIMQHIFETRLSFLHLKINDYQDIIKNSIKKGKSLSFINDIIITKINETILD